MEQTAATLNLKVPRLQRYQQLCQAQPWCRASESLTSLRTHLFLLDERDLGDLGPEILVLPQEGQGAVVRVSRRHDGQRQGRALGVLGLQGQDRLYVLL